MPGDLDAAPTADAAPPRECDQAITDGNAHALFDLLTHGDPGDGCALDELTTDHTEIRIVWLKAGAKVGPAIVAPTSCAKGAEAPGKVLSLVTSGPAGRACAASTAKLRHALESNAFNGLPGTGPGARGYYLSFPVAVACVGALLVAAAFVAYRNRNKRPPAP